jgi:hypothetical protein
MVDLCLSRTWRCGVAHGWHSQGAGTSLIVPTRPAEEGPAFGDEGFIVVLCDLPDAHIFESPYRAEFGDLLTARGPNPSIICPTACFCE